MAKPFEQAAANLVKQLLSTNDANDQETIRQFLVIFAEHILWQTTPASGNTIRKFEGMEIEEIAQTVRDMTLGQMAGINR